MVLVVALAVAGCGDDAQRAAWDVRVEAEGVATLRLRVLEGGCARDPEAFATTVAAGDAARERPPALSPGRYGFEALGLDGDCRVIAAGCEDVRLPLDPPAVVTVVVEPLASPMSICAGSCVAGTCVGPDAGPGADDAGRDSGVEDGGLPDAAPVDAALECTGDEPRCEDTDLVACVDGAPRVTECPAGCGGDPAACLPTPTGLTPSNVRDVVPMDAGDRDLVVEGGSRLIFDTTTGLVVDGVRTVRRAGTGLVDGIVFELMSGRALDLGVFVVRSLVVSRDGSVSATGSAAFILLVETDATIDGRVSVDADLRGGTVLGLAGAGSMAGGEDSGEDGEGSGGGGASRDETFGGAGGSFGSRGGDGGGGVRRGRAQIPYGTTTLEPLVTGSGGGAGLTAGSIGGRGGGAVQISVGGTLTVGATGTISACGSGGFGGGGGEPTLPPGAGGGPGIGGGAGGGSGGAILLEAPTLVVHGRLAANGGGGGAGSAKIGGAGGTHGSADLVPAPGGVAGPFAGAGGDGNDRTGAAGARGETAEIAGGGGGGGGRIRLNAAAVTLDGDVSPALLTTTGPILPAGP